MSNNIESNVKPTKNISRKTKKGVDSLLEKLEHCNKKFCNVETTGSSVVNIDEKDSYSVTSLSPDNSKSRSPYNREDSVISPTFSNDDSNDNKQRRKRKLGKPLRVAKDSKINEENSELITQSNLFTKANVENYKDLKSESNSQTLSKENFGESVLKVIDKNNAIENVEEKKRAEAVTKYLGNNYLIFNKQSFTETIKKKNCIRIRSTSECLLSHNKLIIKRRKSCSDLEQIICNPVQKISLSKNTVSFNEVESELEKMFAGLIETDKDCSKKMLHRVEKSIMIPPGIEQKENLATEQSSKLDNNFKQDKNNSAILKKKLNEKNRFDSTINLQKCKKKYSENKSIMHKTNTLKRKKHSCKLKNTIEPTTPVMNNSYNSKYKGPIIQFQKSKENLMSAHVVNILREDVEEKARKERKNNLFSLNGRSKKLNFQNHSDYRGKSINSSLFNSTLSTRYDAYTADVTWICAFCKRGPHSVVQRNSSKIEVNTLEPYKISTINMPPLAVLSDLFGPYFIREIYKEYAVLTADQVTKDQKGDNNNKHYFKCIKNSEQQLINATRRKKNIVNPENFYSGMTVLDNSTQLEIWIHEQCTMWAAGVYISGGRINGLQDAVWDAAESLCDSCNLLGANITCIKRGCNSIMHYGCALTSGWHLDENQYVSKCNVHKSI